MKKVVVGMSGGVDSSVAAYLLKQKGYDVIGLFMKNWDPALNNDLADPFINEEICQAELDYEDALEVCNKLGIKLHKVDFVKEYWDKVFLYFLEEYKKGRTPNPDIFCNKYIKFQSFLKYAEENFDCDYIAMGHYAKVDNGILKRGIDENKDQTYFLSQLNKNQLKKVLFPIGDIKKNEVRELALNLNLNTANKKDSTGVCFIGERNFGLFLSSYLNEKTGKILDYKSKKIIAKHKGLFYYTIGQRKGLNIGGLKDFNTNPWFVVGKDLNKNELYVSQDTSFLKSNKVIVDEINFLGNNIEDIKTVKFRYRSDDVVVKKINKVSNKFEIEYEDEEAVTPGQACVFYNKEICLGGSIICDVYNNEKKLEV